MKFTIACLIGVAASVHVAQDDFNYDDPCADIDDLEAQFECYEAEICGEEGCPEDPCEGEGESCYEEIIDDLDDGEPCYWDEEDCWEEFFDELAEEDDYDDAPCDSDDEQCWLEYYIEAPCELDDGDCWEEYYADQPCDWTDDECWDDHYGEDDDGDDDDDYYGEDDNGDDDEDWYGDEDDWYGPEDDYDYSADPQCFDLDNGATDDFGDTCLDYAANPSWCLEADLYDDDDFFSNEMCCACGGGGYTGLIVPDDETQADDLSWEEGRALFGDDFDPCATRTGDDWNECNYYFGAPGGADPCFGLEGDEEESCYSTALSYLSEDQMAVLYENGLTL